MKSVFEQEIFEQPAVIRRLVRDESGQIRKIVEQLQARPPKFMLIAARGTSDNAATYAKYLFGMFNHVPVGLAMPSLYTHYNCPPDMSEGLVIGISQSGQTPDVLSILAEARLQAVPSIAITNVLDSPMAQAANYTINLGAGEERAVPASKTYTAQLTAIACIAAYWKGKPGDVECLSGLADLANEVLAEGARAAAVAKSFANKNMLVTVGRGINQCTASEVALKIKELCYIASEAYSAADFRHGPIAMLEAGFPAIAIAPRGKTLGDMTEVIREIRQTGANLAVISNEDSLLSGCELPVRLPRELEEWVSPVIATIPGQLVAMHLCLEKGYDTDRPRGLRKVTLTR